MRSWFSRKVGTSTLALSQGEQQIQSRQLARGRLCQHVPASLDQGGHARRRANISAYAGHTEFRHRPRGPPCCATTTAVLAAAALIAICSSTLTAADPDPVRDYPAGATHVLTLPMGVAARGIPGCQELTARFGSKSRCGAVAACVSPIELHPSCPAQCRSKPCPEAAALRSTAAAYKQPIRWPACMRFHSGTPKRSTDSIPDLLAGLTADDFFVDDIRTTNATNTGLGVPLPVSAGLWTLEYAARLMLPFWPPGELHLWQDCYQHGSPATDISCRRHHFPGEFRDRQGPVNPRRRLRSGAAQTQGCAPAKSSGPRCRSTHLCTSSTCNQVVEWR